MFFRPLALGVMLAAPACAEPRTPGDCTTEPDCLAGYRDAMMRLRVCITDGQRPSPGPASPPPTDCRKLQDEVAVWAKAVSRMRGKKDKDAPEERPRDFEVPPLKPPGS